MKRKLRLKPFVIPIIYTVFVVFLLVTVFITESNYKNKNDNDLTYVTSSIFDDKSITPVINLEAQIMRPYSNSNVKIGLDYYSKDDSEENQKKSIIYYSGTYMPNSGVDYVLKEEFDVLSVLDGEVIEVKEEELLGKTITIRHDTNLVSVYQGLSEVKVKKNDQVSIGQIIGKSGTNELNKDLGNHLHFELTYKGQTVDPENYYDKKINELD